MNKKILFVFLLMIVLSIGAVSAADISDAADDAIASSDVDDVVSGDADFTNSGSASGGVDVVTENPWDTSGEITYDIPANAKTIKSADVYVNVYGTTTDDKYGCVANTTIGTANQNKTFSENLSISSSSDGTPYPVNDHVNKVYLDYMIHYDITSLLTSDLNGTKLKINVDTFKMENKTFEGKIKLIGLVLAYNDDSTDETISYWINGNQLWSKSNVTIPFDTAGKYGPATLTNVVLSSADGGYMINNRPLNDPKKHTSGNTYQYNQWDVTDYINATKDTTLTVSYVGGSQWGSIKNALSVLTIYDINSTMSVATEYSKVAFAGTNNTLTVTVNATKAGTYVVRLLADGEVVDKAEVTLNNVPVPVDLTDPTIRTVDESTVAGADNKKVTYTVELLFEGAMVNSTSIALPVLYNGYLGKDLAYPAGGMESLAPIIINGDIVVDVQDVSTYLNSNVTFNRTDVWTINLDDNSNIVKSFVYVAYNWCDPANANETNLFNAMFNNVAVTPVYFYRDQGNLGTYGKYGYGVLVYDVTDLIKKSGDNTLFLDRISKYKYPAVYPSALVYMYNTTGSDAIKEIYISNGADLLAYKTSSFKNTANRTVNADSTIDVYSKLTNNATLYVFAASAQTGEGNIIFNGNVYADVWSGTDKTTDLIKLDITGKVKDSNSISFVATGNTILALSQIIVLNKTADANSISLATEYSNTAYAGTNNAIKVTIDAISAGKYTLKLLANGVTVNETEVDLKYGANNPIIIIDPTIRKVNETTVNGADNTKVNYTVQLISNDEIKGTSSINVPVLYNGYLGKDLAYPAGGMESLAPIVINGDIVIEVKDVSTYMNNAIYNRTDVWTINLDDKSSIVKSFVYVAYNWCDPANANETNLFNVTFNDVAVAPAYFYRDQSNLGGYGKYGYGVLVYDVTDLIKKSGDNALFIDKISKYKYPAVYPSALVYMYNTTGSNAIKEVYISNGADLLANSYNNAGRTVKADSTINVTTIRDTATLYVFAASAQSGEGNIVFNGDVYANVWSGTSSTTDLYKLDITGKVKNTNDISFVATGSTILALHQIIVVSKNATAPTPTEKVSTTITAPAITKVYNNNKNLVVTLKDSKGNPVTNAKVTVVLNGVTKVLTTDAKGQAKLAIPNLVPKTYTATISYDGDDTHIKSTASAKVVVKKAKVKIVAKKKTFKAKKKVKKYTVTLKNNKGKALKKVKLTLKIKGKKFTAKTNSKGKAIFKIKKLTKKGKYNAKVIFNGNKYYNKLTKKVKITIKK